MPLLPARSLRIPADEGGSCWMATAEIIGLVTLCFLYAGTDPPQVNEAHYLCKAKSFWQPNWCADDFFLKSADAHFVFYWTFGWLTQWVSLTTAAWVGRFISWLAIAIAWWQLTQSYWPKRGLALWAGAMAIALWDQMHMAGEWVVGGVEAKGIAYALVFLAYAALSRLRWGAAFLWLGAASAFHVLVGGWATLGALLVLSTEYKSVSSWTRLAWALGGGALLSLPGLWPALELSRQGTPYTVALAQEVYVFHRLGHHLLPHRMDPWLIGRFVLGGVVWGIFVWRTRLSPADWRLQKLVAAAMLLAAIGATLSTITMLDRPLNAAIMRYYWFRQSDFMLPLGLTAILATRFMLSDRPGNVSGRAKGNLAMAALLLVPTVFFTLHASATLHDRRPEAVVQGTKLVADQAAAQRVDYRDWRDICEFIRESTPKDALFLTPYHHQTFKWYAQRAEFVTWKDVPQDTVGIIEWWQRSMIARRIGMSSLNRPLNMTQLWPAIETYDINYVVLRRTQYRPTLKFPVLHHNSSYLLLVIPPATQSDE
ncbi:MAG: hypothetical protein KDA60_04480 [Planctomycetales bacterium]|nr:hypothetical protein [Planctomycetales bacterium]